VFYGEAFFMAPAFGLPGALPANSAWPIKMASYRPDASKICFWETEANSISQNRKIIKNRKLQGCNSSAVLKTARRRCVKLIERKALSGTAFQGQGTPARLT
jgi:hypothetical protein